MRTTSLVLLVASLLLVGATMSCESTDNTPPNTNSSTTVAQLDGRTFLLQEAVGYTPVAGTVIRVSFSDGDLNFSAGCNSHSGPYELNNGTLVMSGMSATEMGCDAALHTQDEWLADFFMGNPTLALDGDTLTFTSGNVVLTFLDREVADPDRPLVGPTWTVDSLISGDSVSSIMTTLQPPTLSFNSDGSFLVNTDCSTGSGTYTATTTDLTFASVTFATATCTDAAASSILLHLATVFANGTATYGIEAARLTVEQGNVGIMALAAD
jgi:heat shock protein HslJ